MFDGGTNVHDRVAELGGVPGPDLARAIEALGVAGADDEVLLAGLEACERIASWSMAVQAAVLSEFARRHPAGPSEGCGPGGVSPFAVDEVALALRLSRVAAQGRVAFADEISRLPGTAAALAVGAIDVWRARTITDATMRMSDDATARAVEQRVLNNAPHQTAGQLRACVARAVIAADPRGADQRHTMARLERRVVIRSASDGMSELWALLPCDGAMVVRNAIDRLVRTDRVAGDPTTQEARRADALVMLCARADGTDRRGGDLPIGGDSDGPMIVAGEAHVVIDAATLLGLRDDPAVLSGYGPIPAELARRLSADTAWRRLVTCPESGTLLDLGRRRYRPSAALVDYVRARDATCRFPGCQLPARRCDLDHVTPFPAGPTSAANLATTCRHHHRLKHEAPGWKVELAAAGHVRWTTPTGMMITTEPGAVLDGAPRRVGDHDPPPF